MRTNPVKNFLVFTTPQELSLYEHLDAFRVEVMHGQVVADFRKYDPGGGSWGTVHLQETYGEKVYSLDGAGLLMTVRFNERVLPAKVRDEHVAKRVKAVEEEIGRKIGKKDYAQIRDQVETALLPKAFIRRTDILLCVTPENQVLMFTTSPRRCEDMLGVVAALFGEHLDLPGDLSFSRLNTQRTAVGTMNVWANADRSDEHFEAGAAAVLKGKGKRTIRIKDRRIYSDDVQKLISDADNEDDYDVHALELYWQQVGDGTNEDEFDISFMLTDTLAFKGCKLSDVLVSSHASKAETTGKAKDEDKRDDGHLFLYLAIRLYRKMITDVIEACGGESVPVDLPPMSDEEVFPTQATEEDEY